MQSPDGPESDGSRRRLAALLRDRREVLIVRWTQRVLDDPRVPVANGLPTLELRDHVPKLLDTLIRGLDAPGVGVSGRAVGLDPVVREHARQRAANGYLLTEALRELSHFRDVILDTCQGEGFSLEGEAAKYLHAAIDESMITGGEEMEKAALAALERQAAFRERFIGILGHDLRTPIQSILFGAQALLEDDITGIQARVVHRVTASANRMSRMITDVLDLTRARLGGGIPIDPRPTDLGEVVRQVVDELEIARPDKPIVLTVDGSSRGMWDPDRIAQVAANLVSNALDYSAEGKRVAVHVRMRDADAILTVHNHGPTIEAETLAHLFEPFIQGDRTQPREGLGLGLFIAQQIVLAHGGTIDTKSTPEDGTTFTVTLPRRM